MSKGIIMAENMEEAIRSHDSLYLENDLLGAIFYSIEKEKKKYPALFKLVKDGYGDSEFDVTELPKLKAEIDFLLKTKKFSEEMMEGIKKISDIAEEAHKTNKRLFAVAD